MHRAGPFKKWLFRKKLRTQQQLQPPAEPPPYAPATWGGGHGVQQTWVGSLAASLIYCVVLAKLLNLPEP